MAYDIELAERLRDLLAGSSDVTEKRMFGGLGMLVGGHLAVSASSRGGLMLRADPQWATELLADPRIEPFSMRGKSMAGWLHVNVDSSVAADELQEWVDQAVQFARSLPPK